jgi:hypothetical protein
LRFFQDPASLTPRFESGELFPEISIKQVHGHFRWQKTTGTGSLFRCPWALWGAVVRSLTQAIMPQTGHITIPPSRQESLPPPAFPLEHGASGAHARR